MKGWALSAALVVASAASADDLIPSGQAWSAVGARTAGLNANQLEAAAGWPGVEFQYTHGLLSNLDLGVRASVLYGFQGLVNQPASAGIGIQAVLKVKFYDHDRLSLGATFMPGPIFAFPAYQPTDAAFALPVELKLGLIASSALNVGLAIGVPLWLWFGPGHGVVVPITVGGGAEYFVKSDLAVFFDLRMGPTIFGNGSQATLTFDAKVGVAWHL